MTNATWLADVLRGAGCSVVEHDGWEKRGRPGVFGPVKGVLCHHTGKVSSTSAAVELIKRGRPEDTPPLLGPLSHLVLGRDGTFHVVAAGRCNHAGKGRWQGVANGNTAFIGIEAENDGTGGQVWPDVQLKAYALGCAAILEHVKADAVMAAGHREYALPRGRKVDPNFDMLRFRERVEAAMTGVDEMPGTVPDTLDPLRAMLRKGDQGDSVRQLQRALGIRVDGAFGPKTESAVKDFQRQHDLVDDGKVGPKTWAVLGVK